MANKLSMVHAAAIAKLMTDLDLTLECIRRFYLGVDNPLNEVFLRYQKFFGLFGDFRGYVDFFLLQDLVTENYPQVKFYLPFDDFKSAPNFRDITDYLFYQKRVIDFINSRSNRIDIMYNEEDKTVPKTIRQLFFQ